MASRRDISHLRNERFLTFVACSCFVKHRIINFLLLLYLAKFGDSARGKITTQIKIAVLLLPSLVWEEKKMQTTETSSSSWWLMRLGRNLNFLRKLALTCTDRIVPISLSLLSVISVEKGDFSRRGILTFTEYWSLLFCVNKVQSIWLLDSSNVLLKYCCEIMRLVVPL